MPNNISISSGYNFTKKIFGSVKKLTKPAFVHDGRVFSDNTFKNQKTIPLLENSIYYTNHGLKDEDVLIDYDISVSFNDNNIIQQFINNYQILVNTDNLNPRAIESMLKSLESGVKSLSSNSITKDPYDNNPPPKCDVP